MDYLKCNQLKIIKQTLKLYEMSAWLHCLLCLLMCVHECASVSVHHVLLALWGLKLAYRLLGHMFNYLRSYSTNNISILTCSRRLYSESSLTLEDIKTQTRGKQYTGCNFLYEYEFCHLITQLNEQYFFNMQEKVLYCNIVCPKKYWLFLHLLMIITL